MSAKQRTVQLSRNTDQVPEVISIKTKAHAAHLQNWRRGNLRVPWGALLSDALDEYFAKKGKAA
jgi:ribosomal protein L39E